MGLLDSLFAFFRRQNLPEVSFLSSLLISFEAIGKLFIVALVGYVFVKRGHFDSSVLSGLSRLMIDVIVPCALGVAMVKSFRWEDLDQYSPLLLFPALWIIGSAVACKLWFRAIPGGSPDADNAATAMAAVQNSFYIPLPVVMAVMPEHAHVAAVMVGVAVLAVNPLQWTLGTFLVMGKDSKTERDWKSSLFKTLNPPIVGIVGGAVLSLFPPMVAAAQGQPDSNLLLRIMLNSMEIIGKAMNPMAMVVLGGIVATTQIGAVLNLRLVAPVMLSRFVLVPGIIYYLLKSGFIPADRVLAFVLMVEAASPSAMNLVLAAKRYGGDWQVLASLLVVINALGVIVLPLWMAAALGLGL
jgi:predicted permease